MLMGAVHWLAEEGRVAKAAEGAVKARDNQKLKAFRVRHFW